MMSCCAATNHASCFFFAQRTNVLLYAAKRVQLNFDLKKSAFSDTANINRVFAPALWYEEVLYNSLLIIVYFQIIGKQEIFLTFIFVI